MQEYELQERELRLKDEMSKKKQSCSENVTNIFLGIMAVNWELVSPVLTWVGGPLSAQFIRETPPKIDRKTLLDRIPIAKSTN